MGNVETHNLPPVRPDERRQLKLTRKITPRQYQKHVDGSNDIPGALTALPWELVDSISLYEHLDVSFNLLHCLPSELPMRLPHLAFLDLSHNRLTNLPESFALLFHLSTLLLHHNVLQVLPESFVNLVKLERLDLSHNALERLPGGMGRMESLRKLKVSDNFLTTLPTSLGQSDCLEVILAVNNRCVVPPQSVCNEGSDAVLRYLRKQCKNGVATTKGADQGNIFIRTRGDVLQSAVSNPHSARAQYLQQQTETTNTTSRIRTPLRPPLNATTLEADELRDKIVGLLYGAAIGDALGLSTAQMSPDECRFHYDKGALQYQDIIIDKYRLQWDKGDWTTPFDQMVLVLDSLLHWAGVVDELDFAKRLYHWAQYGFPELGDKQGATGFSNTIAKVLTNPKYTNDPHGASQGLWDRSHDQLDSESCDHLADNAAIVRAAILGIPQFHNLKEVVNNTTRICKATHFDPRCQASCVVVSVLIALLLQNDHSCCTSPDQSFLPFIVSVATDMGRKQLTEASHLQDFDDFSNLEDLADWSRLHPNRYSHTFKPMAAALIVLKSGMDFRKAISGLVMFGRDSPSNASVAGAALGCHWGYRKLPQEWVSTLRPKQTQWLDIKINALLDMMAIP
ncbi:uncharacterized protein LOC110982117 [Acanthaster planci]|uniref:Uncharacterized protein LOC110982117 n=1 Tax=Acanthaster planci TaxID=133434 RepID=A0A8B7YXJ8_ACAPL|nr:uncharacterized protein LOC110982117 [Acanthaster planci]XP_022095995.1 uncharacterized protein LOC110982117 [Acanthaster planci]XP_022095996.1 uncharacterized protein LOC110982117 [Acanthaster planci]